jgi:Flp pilus assembly protein TadG
MRRLKSLFWAEEASELVEFALAAGVFFALIFGVIEFCLVIYAASFVAFAAEQGTRYAMVRGSDWTSSCASASSYGCQATATNVQNYVLSLPHPGINLTSSDITPTWLGTTAAGASAACTTDHYAQGCQVKVVVSYSFGLHIPFVPATSIPLTSTSIETIQD